MTSFQNTVRLAARLLIAGLTLVACASTAVRDDAREPDGSLPRISYRFERVQEPALAVRIHAELPGAPGGETTLEVDAEWGGVSDGGVDIGDVTATDGSGAALAVARPEPHRMVVTHAPGASLHVTYAIPANEHQMQTDPGQSRRPIVNEHLFHTVGHLALLRATHMNDKAPCTVRLAWDGFDEAGWNTVSSWGVGTGERTLTVSPYELREALYVAGDIRLITREVRGYPVTITVAGSDWSFTPEAFADVCERIVAAERGFFDDYAREFYWISMIPTGPLDQQGSSIGGTGLNNCFSLQVSPGTPLESKGGSPSALVGIIAHEMFHDWNGLLIKREDPEELVYWFSEGFTDFYARRLRYRSALIDAEQYAALVSETLERYAASPWRDEPNTRIHEDFWNDRDVQKLPYYRGDIVAMMLDDAIRRRSNGTQSLDDVMLRLADNARRGALVDTDNLLATFATFADDTTMRAVRDLVVNGGLPNLEGLFAPCLAIEPTEAYAFDLGFDLERSMKEKKVVGLQSGSAAAHAGLQEGVDLKRWSVRRGDVTQPVSFTIVENGTERDVSYYPRGPAVPAYKARVARASEGCPSL